MHSNTKLRIISLFTALCLCFTLFSANAGAAKTKAKNGASAIVETAVSEIGYKEGAGGYSKYGDYFGSPYEPWACAFVAWCARITGISEETIPSTISSAEMINFFEEKGLFHKGQHYGGEYIPKPGDLVFFTWSSNPGNAEHIGIVESANSTYLNLIDGNRPSKVQKVERFYNSTIIGYASPEYGELSDDAQDNIKNKAPGLYKLVENMVFRTAPSVNSAKAMNDPISANTVIDVTETKFAEDKNWGKINYKGITGWVCLDYSVRYEESKPEEKPDDTKKTPGIYILKETTLLRRTPNLSEDNIITNIYANTRIEVTETEGRWGKINHHGKKGWLRLDWSVRVGDLPSIRPDPDYPEPETKPDPEEVVPEKGLYRVTYPTNLRAKPTTDSSILGKVPAGKLAKVTEIKNNWGKTTVNGVTGWFSLDWSVKFEPEVDWLMLDVSVYQNPEDVDWDRLKAQGVKGVIIRIGGRGGNSAGTGSLYSDTAFFTHYKNAKAAGLHVGTYFFSYAITKAQAEEEAKYTLNLLTKYQADLDLPVFIDMEDLAGDRTHLNAGKKACSDVLETFCSTIEDAGYYAGIYASRAFIDTHIDPRVYNGRAAWVADWNNYDYSIHNGPVDIWQYTETGRLNGIKGNVDLNRCYVNYPALIKGGSSSIRTGDVDKDGSITSSDARLVLRSSVSLEYLSLSQLKLADMDRDGDVTASDARLVLRDSVGL